MCGLKGSVDFAVQSVDLAGTGQCDEFYFLRVTRFETHSRACRDIQAEAAGCFAIKRERGVHLVKMKMAPNLDWPVSSVSHAQCFGFQSGVPWQLGRFSRCNDLAWNHKSRSGLRVDAL